MFNRKTGSLLMSCILFFSLLVLSVVQEGVEEEIVEIPSIPEKTKKINERYNFEISDDGKILFNSNGYGYRYGPSIMKNDDGSMDIWYSSPGNSSSQWDWIIHRHSKDGINWSNESVVLKPTAGSKDQCSVCDPGLIYFNDYYYLAYTATSYYQGKGSNNSAFVARSKSPGGPFEKWNGESWGGKPEPIIEYEGNPDGWGIGEVSFVIHNDELYVYYTYYDENGGSTRLAKANLQDDWPLSLSGDETVCVVTHQDSLDVVYMDDMDTFLAFAIYQRMAQNSSLIIYESKDGLDFKEIDKSKDSMEDYSHNVGISKNKSGHSNSEDRNYIGYGYGASWGKWSLIVREISVEHIYE